jgi:hypothetical protein
MRERESERGESSKDRSADTGRAALYLYTCDKYRNISFLTTNMSILMPSGRGGRRAVSLCQQALAR